MRLQCGLAGRFLRDIWFGVGAGHKVTFASQDIEELIKTCKKFFFLTSIYFYPFGSDRPSPVNSIDDGVIREADGNFRRELVHKCPKKEEKRPMPFL